MQSPPDRPEPAFLATPAGMTQGGSLGGPSASPGWQFAPWWKRVVAYLIDSLVLSMVLGLVAWPLVSNAVSGCVAAAPAVDQRALAACSSSLMGAVVTLALLSIVASLAYFGLLDGSARGQTLGKRALGIATRDAATGGAIGPVRAAARILVMGLLAFPLLLGLPWLLDVLWPLWDSRRQAWHDKLTGSVVVEWRSEDLAPAAMSGPLVAPMAPGAAASGPQSEGSPIPAGPTPLAPPPGVGLASGPDAGSASRPGWLRFAGAVVLFVASVALLGVLISRALQGGSSGAAPQAITMPHVTLSAPPISLAPGPTASSSAGGAAGASPVLAAGLDDQFDQDRALDTSRWRIDTVLLRAMAARLGETLLAPTLAFTPHGMAVSGVTGPFTFTGLQSTQAFAPPLALTAVVTGTRSSGNPFGLVLISASGTEFVDIAGNLNPENRPYYGIRFDVSGAPEGLGHYLGNTALVTAPRVGVAYTLHLSLEADGSCTATVLDPAGDVLGHAAGVGVGRGPFYVVLAQWEGGPRTPGPNVAIWRSLTLESP